MNAPASVQPPASRLHVYFVAMLFIAVAIGGLFYVKWQPYFGKAIFAAAHHSLGTSILSGTQAVPPAVGWRAGLAYSIAYVKAIWQALVLGLVLGAGIEALLPRATLGQFFAGSSGSIRATAFAIPSMMCTCCSAPIAVGLIESGVAPTSAIIYWLANPVLNPATLIFIGFALGWHWVALRLVVGAALVFTVGYVAARVIPSGFPVASPPRAQQVAANQHFLIAWLRAFVRLAIRLLPEYVVIVFVLGVVRAWLFPQMTPVIGHAYWLAPALAAAGTLLVIPTAGEVPIVQVLQHFGLGGAGAAALLITLPAVSLPSLFMMARALPARVILVLGLGTFVFGLLGAVATIAFGFS